jgi:hypothetical protein
LNFGCKAPVFQFPAICNTCSLCVILERRYQNSKPIDSSKIADIIKNKFNNIQFFSPSIINGKISIQQKIASLRFNIDKAVSDVDKSDENTSWFLIDGINQAAEIIDILSDHQDFEKCKELVADFVRQHNVDTKQTLYFKAYLSPS